LSGVAHSIEVSFVLEADISEAERTAVRWVLERLCDRSARASWVHSDRISVRRASPRPYDLLICAKAPSIKCSAGARRSSFSLVKLCLDEFHRAGFGSAVRKDSSYDQFSQIVLAHQWARARETLRRNTSRKGTWDHRIQTLENKRKRAVFNGPSDWRVHAPDEKIGQSQEEETSASVRFPLELSGDAYFQHGESSWRAKVDRAVLREDGILIELSGQLVDGSHYKSECNLQLRGERFVGRGTSLYRESKEMSEAHLDIVISFSKGRDLELMGTWGETTGFGGELEFGFELDLRT